MGQASVTVDGGAPTTLDGFSATSTGDHTVVRVANGLADGPHQVQIGLLSTTDSASTGNTFDVLSVGAGGVFGATQQTISFVALPDQTYGTAPFTVTATASSGLPVSFTSTNSPVCTVSGSTVTLLAIGTCTINAIQSGNSIYAPATVSQSFSVDGVAQSITFGAIGTQTVGTPLTLSASASSGLPVSFASSTPAVCTLTGAAATFIASGTCTLLATQMGNNMYVAASPVSQSFTVNGEAQSIAFNSIAAQTVGTPLTLSASASSGLEVSFDSTTPVVCTVSGATASFITSGACTIQATQAGSSTYAAATPISQSFTVNGEGQTITFGAIAYQTVGTTLTLSASASSGLPVSFASTTAAVCTVSGAMASFIGSGLCNIQATQAGNDMYAAATAVTQGFTVTNPAPAIFGISPQFVIAGSAAQTITLTGERFLPGTTATFAGSAHAITYLNSTTIVLPLTASDLAASGVQAIVVTNPGPGGGFAPVNLPVLYEDNAMLANSQLAAGDQARMQRLVEKERNGTPITMVTMGGSITAGGGASNGAHYYGRLLQDWWNQSFPASTATLVNAGIGGTKSDYGSLRTARDVLSYNPDLVIVEFAINDNNAADYGDTYEGLVRQLLDAPSQPAVILLFMMTYEQPIVESDRTDQPWQSAIGANYDVPMVSYYDAIAPELLNGNITFAQITADNIHPTDLGHAYAAQFLEQNIQLAINNFPPGTALEPIPATEAPVYSSDLEFTSLEEGNGDWGPPLNPTNNQGWVAVSTSPGGRLGYPDEGLESSTPGSTLDFTVTGKEILIGYWVNNAPMGQASVTVDGGAPTTLDGFSATSTGDHTVVRVANGLADGPHQVQIQLLSTSDSGSTGTTFDVLCVGAGGVD
jgi:lysophospholipase L1-like esterase